MRVQDAVESRISKAVEAAEARAPERSGGRGGELILLLCLVLLAMMANDELHCVEQHG